MANRGKKYLEAREKIDRNKRYELEEGVKLLTEAAYAKFDEGVDLAITISLGVASMPAHARERNGLVAAADKALYLAKETGKNQVKAFPALAT